MTMGSLAWWAIMAGDIIIWPAVALNVFGVWRSWRLYKRGLANWQEAKEAQDYARGVIDQALILRNIYLDLCVQHWKTLPFASMALDALMHVIMREHQEWMNADNG
jgi:hypothetical protein